MTEKLNWGLYIGQKVCCQKKQDVILGLTTTTSNQVLLHCQNNIYNTSFLDCQPILRSLDQMTDDEKEEFSKVFLDDEYLEHITVDNYFVTLNVSPYSYTDSNIRVIDWLTEKGFAIRGEFERGVAVKEN